MAAAAAGAPAQADEAVPCKDRHILHHQHLGAARADANRARVAVRDSDVHALEDLVTVGVGLRSAVIGGVVWQLQQQQD